jgi:hypothetical protein
MTTQTKKTNAPIFKKRHGRLQVSVFEDLSEDGRIRFSTYIQRNYKSGDGHWKVGAFSEEDLDDLSKARELAQEQIKQRKTRYSKQQLR